MPDPQLSYPAFAAHGKFGGYGPLAFPMHRMGMTRPTDFIFGTQIRKSPFFDATMKWGVKAFSVYNHMYLPRSFGDEVANFWTLVNDAILCDVAAERQVEIAGPDAARFMQLLTPRDLSGMERGECKYIVLTDQRGGILNDPILLKLARDRFWISLADSDVLLWAKGVAVHGDMQVFISEPDASPLQLQGPKSAAIMQRLLGDSITDLEFFHHRQAEVDRIPLRVSRTGWSKEFGYEIFLLDHRRGEELWDRIMAAGEPLGLKPGHTSTIRRIEGALLSYRADADSRTNPYELNMGWMVDPHMQADFIGKAALRAIRQAGPRRRQMGLVIEGEPMHEANSDYWGVQCGTQAIGKVTSAIHSPRLEQNIALALLDAGSVASGDLVTVRTPDGPRAAEVVPLPFYDPGNDSGGD